MENNRRLSNTHAGTFDMLDKPSLFWVGQQKNHETHLQPQRLLHAQQGSLWLQKQNIPIEVRLHTQFDNNIFGYAIPVADNDDKINTKLSGVTALPDSRLVYRLMDLILRYRGAPRQS